MCFRCLVHGKKGAGMTPQDFKSSSRELPQIGRKPQFHSSNDGWTTFDSLVALIWPLKRGNGCYKRQKSPGKTHTHTHTVNGQRPVSVQPRYDWWNVIIDLVIKAKTYKGKGLTIVSNKTSLQIQNARQCWPSIDIPSITVASLHTVGYGCRVPLRN